MTLTRTELAAIVGLAQAEIVDDVRQGVVPPGIPGFSELHDYVDANVYGGLCDAYAHLDLDDVRAVQDAVHEWIVSGGVDIALRTDVRYTNSTSIERTETVTADDDTYNGWTNRETWALNLHYSNDEGLYSMTNEHAAAVLHDDPDASDRHLGERVAEFLQTLHEELGSDSDGLRMMREEVGSWWRVDHAEIGAHVRNQLSEEDMLPSDDDDDDDDDDAKEGSNA